MTEFSELGISVETNAFIGDKVKMSKILNTKIEVQKFKIEESKFKENGNGKRLVLQILWKSEMHIVFSGSLTLQNAILRVPINKFPFTTTIIKQDECYVFS